MRTALARKSKRGAQVSKIRQQVAPIKGWVANKNIARIPSDAAWVLDNWIPETNQISIRPGYAEHADPEGGVAIETLMVHSAGGTKQLFACEGTSIWDVTTVNTEVEDVTGLTNAIFSWANFTTSANNYIYLLNGADVFQAYDGTTWSEPSVTGITMADYNYVFVFANRLFFLKENSSTMAYLEVDAIAGAATTFEVGGELKLGGELVAGAALTHDAGDGPEDYCIFLSSEGEVIVYQGTNPSNVDTWAKKGGFRIGRPIGKRCLLQIGGDLGVLTQDGVVSLARSILLDRAAATKGAFSDNIRTAFADQYALSGSIAGWELITWPTSHLAIVNIPITAGVTFHQYVMNVLTGAWCRFLGIDSTTWVLSGDDLYFGAANGKIYQFGNIGSDDAMEDPSSAVLLKGDMVDDALDYLLLKGDMADDASDFLLLKGDAFEVVTKPVNALAIGAFDDYGSPGYTKHVKGARIFARTDSNVTIGVNMTPDFTLVEDCISTADFGAVTGSVFGTGVFGTATWAASSGIADSAWLGVAEVGDYIAPVICGTVDKTATAVVKMDFLSMTIIYEKGNPLG
jgi:hypothetical protein